jgi:hypothetical protein
VYRLDRREDLGMSDTATGAGGEQRLKVLVKEKIGDSGID